MIDVTVDVEDTSLIGKYKLIQGGAVCNDGSVDRDDLVSDLLKLPNHTITPGGCGTNPARAAAYALKKS